MTPAPIDRAESWAAANGVESDRVSPDHLVVQLPGERKLKTTVSLRGTRHALKAQAFVIRHPDENQEQFWRWLLQRNGRLRGLAFMTDPLGDVYLTAELPPGAVDDEQLDRLLGSILTAADESFNELLVIGFLTSMKKEWAWRVSRGESTRNLAAFAHILDPEAGRARPGAGRSGAP